MLRPSTFDVVTFSMLLPSLGLLCLGVIALAWVHNATVTPQCNIYFVWIFTLYFSWRCALCRASRVRAWYKGRPKGSNIGTHICQPMQTSCQNFTCKTRANFGGYHIPALVSTHAKLVPTLGATTEVAPCQPMQKPCQRKNHANFSTPGPRVFTRRLLL